MKTVIALLMGLGVGVVAYGIPLLFVPKPYDQFVVLFIGSLFFSLVGFQLNDYRKARRLFKQVIERINNGFTPRGALDIGSGNARRLDRWNLLHKVYSHWVDIGGFVVEEARMNARYDKFTFKVHWQVEGF